MKKESCYVFLLGIIAFLIFITVVDKLTNDSIDKFKNTNEHTSVPMNVWQTYRSRDIPPEAEKCRQSWVHQKGIKYHFMDDSAIEHFIRQNYNEDVYRVFISLPLGVMKADLWRYCVLYKRGGIYSDIDSMLLRPISKWGIEPTDKIVIALENEIHFCQWTIVSVPKHPILKNVINMIVQLCKLGIDISDEHFVHKYTGPGIWTKAINHTLGFKPEQKSITTWDYSKQAKYKPKFLKLGLKLESKSFFNGDNVKNLFGSTQFSDGYDSWTKERDKLRSNII